MIFYEKLVLKRGKEEKTANGNKNTVGAFE
jgi:hypothetical protein